MKYKIWLLTAALALIVIFSVLQFMKKPAPEIILPPQKVWGAYAPSVLDFKNFEKQIGKKADIKAVFVSWTERFPEEDKSKTLLIFWEPECSYNAVLNGDWDFYIKQFAEDAKNYGGPVLLVPFAEMNINEYPWSGTANNNSPADFIKVWRRVRGLFSNAQNVKFGWAVNHVSVPNTEENSIEKYYPGDEYVDYVGVDGFNFGDPWQSYSEIFSPALSVLSEYNKPIYIFSMASAQGPKKPAWIADALSQIYSNPKIKGWVWFNENKEKNWLVSSDPDSLEAFYRGIK